MNAKEYIENRIKQLEESRDYWWDKYTSTQVDGFLDYTEECSSRIEELLLMLENLEKGKIK